VTIVDRLCVDTMSGMPRPNRVTVLLDGRELNGCGGDPAVLLQGAEWVVEDIAGAGIVDGSRATLNFGADGQLAGSGSCNRYSGSYMLTGEGLSVSSKTAMTMMACVPALMQQESRFMELLSQVRRFRLGADGALILESDTGGTITARRQ
jgi:heat shock protein HslJ